MSIDPGDQNPNKTWKRRKPEPVKDDSADLFARVTVTKPYGIAHPLETREYLNNLPWAVVPKTTKEPDTDRMVAFLTPEQTGPRYPAHGAPKASIAHARHTDPETSHAAAQRVTEITERQRSVLRLIPIDRGVTDPYIESAYNQARRVARDVTPAQSESGLRTRRAELVELGYVVASGKTDGFTLWRLTPKGVAARNEPM